MKFNKVFLFMSLIFFYNINSKIEKYEISDDHFDQIKFSLKFIGQSTFSNPQFFNTENESIIAQYVFFEVSEGKYKRKNLYYIIDNNGDAKKFLIEKMKLTGFLGINWYCHERQIDNECQVL